MEDDLADLAYFEEHRSSIADDPVRVAALKYTFITVLQGVLAVAQHLCASEGWGPPSTNAHAVELLGSHEVMDRALARRVAGAVGFRNVLVHQYAEVDDRRTVANLEYVDDLRAFRRDVAAWLLRTTG